MAPIFFFVLFLSSKLLAQPAWDKLLHVYRGEPLIKDSDFLATYNKNQKFSTQAELAYWGELFTKEEKDKVSLSQRSFCRFPARYLWWSHGKLHDPSKVCPKFSIFYSEFDTKKVFAIFSSYYAQSSSSLFGHTLLRFSRAESRDQELLDWGVSYAADNTSMNAIESTYRAFFGSFDGSVQVMPYYYKVREYNDFEFRPLWSYELNLTPAEIKFLVFHLWELSGFNIKYEYLGHNCSSLILDILSIVKPEIDFRKQIAFYHIPIDTIKVLQKNNLIKGNAIYRPSLVQVWEEKYNNLNHEEKKIFSQFLKSQNITMLESSTKLIDAALDFYDYKYGKELAGEDPKHRHLQKIKNDLLIARSKKENRRDTIVTTKEFSPDHIHETRRIGLGAGFDDKSQEKIILNYRFAYHDPMDNPQGMTSRMKINIMQTALAYVPQDRKVRLEQVDLVDVASWSISPPLNWALSYEIKASWERWVETEYIDGYRLQAAGGYTFDLGKSWYLATMLENLGTYAKDREHSFSDKIGPQILIHYDHSNFRFRLVGKKLYEITGYQKHLEILDSYEANFSFNIAKDQILALSHHFYENYNESLMTWYKYF